MCWRIFRVNFLQPLVALAASVVERSFHYSESDQRLGIYRDFHIVVAPIFYLRRRLYVTAEWWNFYMGYYENCKHTPHYSFIPRKGYRQTSYPACYPQHRRLWHWNLGQRSRCKKQIASSMTDDITIHLAVKPVQIWCCTSPQTQRGKEAWENTATGCHTEPRNLVWDMVEI